MSHIKKMQTLMTHEQSCKMCGSIYISWVHPKALNYSYFRCLTCRHEWLNIPTDSEGENHFESIQKVYYEGGLLTKPIRLIQQKLGYGNELFVIARRIG